MATRANNNYKYSVHGENSLLKAAGRERNRADCGADETDHVVELQLVVAALNTLPSTTYTTEGWQTQLVDFFNKDLNLQCMKRETNREKGRAVRTFIRGGWLAEQERTRITAIKNHWIGIKHQLYNFVEFKAALDGILARV